MSSKKTVLVNKIKQLIDSLPNRISQRIKIVYSFPNSQLSKLIEICVLEEVKM